MRNLCLRREVGRTSQVFGIQLGYYRCALPNYELVCLFFTGVGAGAICPLLYALKVTLEQPFIMNTQFIKF